jgi:hypothetical protein
MTVSELCHFLMDLIKQNKGHLPIYFDTEARTFDFHMARIGSAFCEEEPIEHVALHED